MDAAGRRVGRRGDGAVRAAAGHRRLRRADPLVGRRPRRFWAAATEFTGVRWVAPPAAIREGDTMPGVRWFPGATLNYAEHALAPRATRPTTSRSSPAARPATASSSRGRSCATRSGARPPGCVASASVRATGSPPTRRTSPRRSSRSSPPPPSARSGRACAPEFGIRSVVDRFEQIEPDRPGRGRRLPLRREGDRPARRGRRRSRPRCRRCATSCTSRTSTSASRSASPDADVTVGRAPAPDDRRARPSSRCRSTTRSTCSTARARPGCRRRSCTATAASSSSTSRCSRCTTTSAPATASSGSPPPAG